MSVELDAAEGATLMALAEAAARSAGGVVRRERPAQVAVAATKSSPTDVVTEMDRAAEQVLRDYLRVVRPRDGVLGEEAGALAGTSGLTWVLDPIDGTVNYLYGIPAYAVSVAVVTGNPSVPGRWRPLAGCVHNPATGQTWTAAAGIGAFVDGSRLPPLRPPALDQALVGTGFSYQAQRRHRQAQVVADLLARVRDVRRLGCAAIDLCMVADGRLDAYYEQGLNAWDMAAGMLVAREAGARVAGLSGHEPGPAMVVAGRAPLVDELAEHLSRLDADR